MTNLFAYTTVRLSVEKAKQYYYICSMLTALFEPACYGTMFYVFYAILHLFWVPITNPSAKEFSIVKNVHWAIVGIFAALVIIDWSWAILFLNSAVHAEFIYIQQNAVWEKIDSARSILFWLASWEVLAWALYLGLMTSRKASLVKIKVRLLFVLKSHIQLQ